MSHPRLAYLFFIIIALLGLVAALNLATEVSAPFGGFFVGYSHAGGNWLVEASTPPWWPVIGDGQLRYDDVLVTIDGFPYDANARAHYAADAGSKFTLTINQGVRMALPVRTFTFSNYLDIKLPDLINGLGFWLLGLAVLRARERNPVNRVFALAAGVTAGSIWLTTQSLFIEASILTNALQLAWIGCASFVGVSFIHLTCLFPAPFHRQFVRIIRLLYIFMATVAIVYMAGFILRWTTGPSSLSNALIQYSNLIVIGSTGAGVIAYLARLGYLLSRPAISRRLRRQSAILLIGVGLAVPYVLIIVLRALADSSQAYFIVGLDIRYLTLAVPTSFAFVILRYQTLQRIHPAVAAVFTLATSALLASLATWLMRLIEPGWMNQLTWSPFLSLFLVSLITATFYAIQNTLRGAFSKVFQWEFRSYTAVRKFTQQIVDRANSAPLPSVITKALVDKLELEQASIWLWDQSQRHYRLAGLAGQWPSSPPDPLIAGEPPLSPIRLHDESQPIPPWLEPFKQSDTIEIIAPLTVSGESVGLLGLGKRWDEEIFDNRDLEIIELVAQQSALFILTAEQIEQLRKVPHQITAAQEHERFRIAQELHDTVQQFLGRLPFYLQVGHDQARANPAETESILQRCIADVQDAAQTVRQIRSNLAPLQLENGLIQPLTTLIGNFHARTGLAVESNLSAKADNLLALEARHALYRVVQQALDNIAAHAQATQVTVTLTVSDHHLQFCIADNGHGITELDRQQAEARGSFGLVSMRARITALGGEFNLTSSPESGTQISGWLPSSAPN